MKAWGLLVLLLQFGLFAGCSTFPDARSVQYNDQELGTIQTLFDLSRTMCFTNGIQCALVSDVEVVDSCQALLMHYAKSNEDAVRLAAACCLIRFGTKVAFERGLELARTEESPAARARLWTAAVELLWKPIVPSRGAVVVDPDADAAVSEVSRDALAQVLVNPELSLVLSCCWRPPMDSVLPSEVDLSEIEQAIVSHYEADAGEWKIEAVDRIPFVPFFATHYTFTRTVRESIADTLEWAAFDSPELIAVFQVFSKSPDEAISAPAAEFLRVAATAEQRMLRGFYP
jgi:hypothetical protein